MINSAKNGSLEGHDLSSKQRTALRAVEAQETDSDILF
jgi:hypothetical protein